MILTLVTLRKPLQQVAIFLQCFVESRERALNDMKRNRKRPLLLRALLCLRAPLTISGGGTFVPTGKLLAEAHVNRET